MADMGRVYDGISAELQEFLERQPMFFVATAPLARRRSRQRVPKGLDGTFAVLGPHRVAYLDLTGSGIETIAHVRENGRITLMFCAFDGPARIVRLFGRGRGGHLRRAGYVELAAPSPTLPGARAVDHASSSTASPTRAATACRAWSWSNSASVCSPALGRRATTGLAEYRAERNATSIDGLPGF